MAAKPAAGVAGRQLALDELVAHALVGGEHLGLVLVRALGDHGLLHVRLHDELTRRLLLVVLLDEVLEAGVVLGDVVRLLVGVAGEEVGLRAVLRLVGDRLRVLLVEVRGARVLLIVVEHRRRQAERLLAVLGLRELRILRDGQVALDRLVELEEAVVVARRVPQRLLAPLGVGIAAVEALVALGRLAELEQLLVDDAGVVERGGRARILAGSR